MKDRKQNIEITDLKQILPAENTSVLIILATTAHTYTNMYTNMKRHTLRKHVLFTAPKKKAYSFVLNINGTTYLV